jgi:hypothetical protein
VATQPHYRRGIVSNLAHFDFDIVSDFDIRISDFSLSACPSSPACRPSTLVETPLQIAPFFAKQTQFPNPQNHHNLFYPKDLPQYSAPSNEKKQSQNKPNPATPGKHRESSIQHQVSSPVFAKQTQFQNGQNKHKYSNNNGLCQQTTNNEQRTLFKTNPIKPNSPTRKTAESVVRLNTCSPRNHGHQQSTLHSPGRGQFCEGAWAAFII